MAFHHTACFVFTVMIICNAILYPSIFSNIFRQWFGFGAKEDKDDSSAAYPPHMRHSGPRSPPNRVGPMAGERAAAQMSQGQKDTGGGKSRGLMSSVLPVYAIGIIVYFAYIMYRIFFKEQTTKDPITGQNVPRDSAHDEYAATMEARKHREYEERLQRSLQEDLRSDKYRRSATTDSRRPKKTATAANANRKGSEENDVASLQKRLEDTEKAMQKMMEYMNKMGVAMSQVTEQMAQNDPTGPAAAKRDSPTRTTYMNDHEMDNLDDEYIDEDDYEDEVVVKKVPARKAPVGKKFVMPAKKGTGQKIRSHSAKTAKAKSPPRKRVVYVEEIDDEGEEVDRGNVEDLEMNGDEYHNYLRQDDDDDPHVRAEEDPEDSEDDRQKFDDAEEEEEEEEEEEAYEDNHDDNDDDYEDDNEVDNDVDDDEYHDGEVLEDEVILPESLQEMSESIRKRLVKVDNQEGDRHDD